MPASNLPLRLIPANRRAQERGMLSGRIDVRPSSRLTCQIVLNDALDGLVIEVPESQT